LAEGKTALRSCTVHGSSSIPFLNEHMIKERDKAGNETCSVQAVKLLFPMII